MIFYQTVTDGVNCSAKSSREPESLKSCSEMTSSIAIGPVHTGRSVRAYRLRVLCSQDLLNKLAK